MIRSANDERALRVLKRMKREYARKQDAEGMRGSGRLAAFYYTVLEEIDKRIAQIEAP